MIYLPLASCREEAGAGAREGTPGLGRGVGKGKGRRTGAGVKG